MLVVFSLEQLKMIRSSLRMSIDINHREPSFRFNEMMDLYQIVCTYSGRKEDNIQACDENQVEE